MQGAGCRVQGSGCREQGAGISQHSRRRVGSGLPCRATVRRYVRWTSRRCPAPSESMPASWASRSSAEPADQPSHQTFFFFCFITLEPQLANQHITTTTPSFSSDLLLPSVKLSDQIVYAHHEIQRHLWRERVFIERVTSDRRLKASREGSKGSIYRTLTTLTRHNVKREPINTSQLLLLLCHSRASS